MTGAHCGAEFKTTEDHALNLCARPAALAALFFAATALCAVSPAGAAAKSHRPHQAAAGKAARLARLAAKEKAAWHEHLAKVRELPRAERVALKRHDRRLKRQQQHSPEELAQLAAEQKRAWREHLAKVAALDPRRRRKMLRHDAHVARAQGRTPPTLPLVLRIAAQTAAPPRHHAGRVARAPRLAPSVLAHNARLAQRLATDQRELTAHVRRVAQAQAAHQAALSAHQAKVAKMQAAHAAHLADLQAAHEDRVRAQQRLIAQRALNHQLRLSKAQQAHDAKLAAQRAHWVALHGDGSGGRSIQFWQTEAAGVPVKCITVDLNDSNVKVSAVMALRGNGTSEPFRQMIDRARPNVAVTGTFFSLDNLYPVGDIVIDGGLVHFGGMGTALCVTPDNRAQMVTCEWGRHHDWSPYDFVVACGPRLLRRGQVVLDPRSERFRDQHMLAPNSRVAVGITRGNKLVFAMTHTPIYLGRLAKVMRSLGASEAMNLDAGTSTGFYYNGATLAKPGRKLTNMIVVYGRRDRYERALDQLVPAAYRRSETRYAHRQVSQLVGR